MSYDPWDPNDPLRKMMEEMERIRRMTEPYSDAVRQAQRDLEWMKRDDIVGQMQRQLQSEREWQRYAVNEGRAILQAFEERREIRNQLEQGQIQRQMTEALNTSRLGSVLREAAAAGDIFFEHRKLINGYVSGTFSGARTLPVAPSAESSSFQQTNQQLAESYEALSESMEPEGDENAPPSAQKMTTVEAFTSAEVVEELVAPSAVKEEAEEAEAGVADDRQNRRQLREELQQESQHQLRPALEALDPRLIKMWDGGGLALSGENPDQVRHFSASRRELMTHVLHLLAPDDEIRKWNTEPSLYHEGKPTRMARLRYICRSIDQAPFGEFVKSDCRSMLATFDLFQRGTHELEVGFTPEQLKALAARAEHHLLFLLQLGTSQN